MTLHLRKCRNDGEFMELVQKPQGGLFWKCPRYPVCIYMESATRTTHAQRVLSFEGKLKRPNSKRRH
jgi:ssDNA-binding Zn-finger/Zn-ribbon topoisomerase 1